MNDYTFGNFLYELRIEKGISQSQLGEMLGVTNKAVSKWENGSAKPNTNLIPKISKIFGVTVEELFAGKRLEKEDELEKIKSFLASQRKRYAVLSSVFFSALIILPLLSTEFTCVVMGFNLPDDVIGPLGSVGFLFAFVISLVAFIIYQKNLKHTSELRETQYSIGFVNMVKITLLSCLFAWLILLVLTFSVYWLMIFFSTDLLVANIFLSIAVFVLILLLGIVICFAKIKRSLKIKLSSNTKGEKRSLRFSELPAWGKVCYIIAMVTYPIVLSIQIQALSNNSLFFIKLVSLVIWLAFLLAVIILMKKENEK